MIVDSSAVVAILQEEPGWEVLADAIEKANVRGIGAPTVVEAGLVLTARMGTVGKTLLARFLQRTRLTVIPFGDQHWEVAVGAFGRYGKGRHPASLNFGDCISYATAWVAGEPLLYIGKDFMQTDIASAL